MSRYIRNEPKTHLKIPSSPEQWKRSHDEESWKDTLISGRVWKQSHKRHSN